MLYKWTIRAAIRFGPASGFCILLFVLTAIVRAEHPQGIASADTRSVQVSPGDAAETCLDNDDMPGALAILTKAIEKNPRDASALTFRACLHKRQGNRVEADKDIRRAIEIDPVVATFYFGSDWNYGLRPKARRVIDFLYGSLDSLPWFIDDSNIFLHLVAGDCKLKSRVTQTQSSQPKSVKMLALRGAAFLEENECEKALADFTEAVGLAPQDVNGYAGRSLCYLAKNDLDKALADISRAVQLNPKSSLFCYSRAKILSKSGDRAEAAKAYDRAIELAAKETHAGEFKSMRQFVDDMNTITLTWLGLKELTKPDLCQQAKVTDEQQRKVDRAVATLVDSWRSRVAELKRSKESKKETQPAPVLGIQLDDPARAVYCTADGAAKAAYEKIWSTLAPEQRATLKLKKTALPTAEQQRIYTFDPSHPEIPYQLPRDDDNIGKASDKADEPNRKEL